MILADSETRLDLLNNEAIATTIISVIKAHAGQGITVGVHGDWGAGKSTILELIDGGLECEEGVLCIKFNGWRFQGFEDAKIALIEGIVTELVERRPALTKAAGVVREVFSRIDWLKVARHGGGLALTALTGVPSAQVVGTALSALRHLASDPKELATPENLNAAVEAVSSLMTDEATSKSVPQEIGEFRKAFDRLLDEAGVDQLVVLIDDLDRCLPDNAIETLEAIRLFVFTAQTAFVVAADEAMIEYAVRKHFPDLPESTGPRDYARNYLEKLVQVPFRIPALGEAETRTYVLLLLIGAELGEADTKYLALVDEARTRLKKPWEGALLDPKTITDCLGSMSLPAQNALMISDQLGPILAAGSRGNPRQIKRFLNTLFLRRKAAEARGFGEDVRLPVLAKLLLAERFIPRLFDQIATSAAADASGRMEELSLLESAPSEAGGAPGATEGQGDTEPEAERPQKGEDPTRADAAAKARGGKGATGGSPRKDRGPETDADSKPSPPESRILQEWMASLPILEWARVQPPIGAVDLRPYLFLSKDRKDYFGSKSVLGHLQSVVEQLMGPKVSVEAMASELAELAAPEAAQVFEALRGRIASTDELSVEPPGVAGLTTLVRAHPSLQPQLLAFLESLPADHLGVWVVRGWSGVLDSPVTQSRFDLLLGRWEQEGGAVLQAAARATLKTRQRGGR